MKFLSWLQSKNRKVPALFAELEIGTSLRYLYFTDEEQEKPQQLWLGVLLRRRSVQAWEAKDVYSGAN